MLRWQQRYFANATHWKGNGSPIFIMIGGEGPIDSRYTKTFYYTKYAEQFGALLLAPEHRFYGLSQPTGGDLSVQSLYYLSSSQALADLAAFRQGMVAKYHAPDSPVIVFGGSYPGSLSAWFRLKYPGRCCLTRRASLAERMSYVFRVRARNHVGWGPYKDVSAAVLTRALLPPPTSLPHS